MKKHWKDIAWQMTAFLICFLPRLVVCCIRPTEMRLIQDEMGKLASTVYLAGLDWSPVMRTTSYYGAGFYFLFAPILARTDDFVLFYFILRVSAALVCSLSAIVAYYIAVHFLEVKDRRYACVLAVISSYCMSGGIRTISNEYMLGLVTWLAALLLLRLYELEENRKIRRIVDTFLLVVILFYSLTLHTRSIILYLSVFLMVIAFRILTGKKIVNLPVFIGSLGLGYLAVRRLESFLVARLWQPAQGELLNTSDSLATSLKSGFAGLTEPGSIQALAVTLFGNVYTLFFFSAGLACVVIVFAFDSLKNCLPKKLAAQDRAYQHMTFLFWTFLFCIMVIIAGLCYTWYGGVAAALTDRESDIYVYSYKAVVYLRYYACYTGPVILVALVYFKEYAETIAAQWKKYMIYVALLIVVWSKYIVVYVVDYEPCAREFGAATFAPYLRAENGLLKYLPATGLLLVFTMLLFYFANRKNQLFFACVVVLFMVYSRCYYDVEISATKYHMADGGLRFVKELEEKQLDFGRNIYVESSAAMYVYQALLNRYTIIPGLPDADTDAAIVFARSEEAMKKLPKRGYLRVPLDADEVVWIKGITLDSIDMSSLEWALYGGGIADAPLIQDEDDMDQEP